MTAESLFLDLINSDVFFSFVVFILIFNILYLGLKMTNFLKDKKLHFVVALIAAVLSVAPHYLGFGFDIVGVMSRFLPNFGVLIIFTIFLIMIAGLFGKETDFFLKNGFIIFSVIFLITINGVVLYLFPEVFGQFLSISLLMAVLSSFSKEKGIVSFLPMTFVVIFFGLLYFAIVDGTSLPGWIAWIGDPLIYKILIGVFAFIIIIKLVLRD